MKAHKSGILDMVLAALRTRTRKILGILVLIAALSSAGVAAAELYGDISIVGDASFREGRTIRPDIVVHIDQDTRVVIDTKWKDPERQEPSSNDLNQMFAYNHQVRAVHSLILYPDMHGTSGRGARFKQDAGFAEHGCSFDFARIWSSNEGKITLNAEVGADVLGMVERVICP